MASSTTPPYNRIVELGSPIQLEPPVPIDTEDVYVYEPLDQYRREIRLFTLGIPWGGFVRCSMTNCSEKDLGRFAALSYVWGDTNDKEHILVNGKWMQIYSNFHKALCQLHRLRAIDPNQPHLLWADAICLDQGNEAEKNREIKRMGFIYRSAEVVYSILSAPTPTQSEPYLSSPWKLLEQALLICSEYRRAPHYRGRLPLLSTDEWRAYATFADNEYFQRLWIMQEIILAQKVLVLVGDLAVPWNTVYKAAGIARIAVAAVQSHDDRLKPLEEASRYLKKNAILSICRMYELGTHRLKFQADCTSTYEEFGLQDSLMWDAEAGRGQDLVYGMLGLLHPSQAEYITVNYTKTPAAVWTDYSASRINCWQDLSSLPMLSCSTMDPTLPSWITHPHHRQPVFKSGFYDYDMFEDSDVDFRPEIHGAQLTATGVILDSISGLSAAPRVLVLDDAVSHIPSKRHPPYMSEDTPRGAVGFEGYSQSGSLISNGNTIVRLWKCLCLGKLQVYGEGSGILTHRTFRKLQRGSDLYWFFNENRDLKLPGGVDLGDCFARDLPDMWHYEVPEPEHDLLDLASLTVAFLRLAHTTNGRLGMEPPDARKGDRICALYGLDGLALLRPQGNNRWQWVGRCYVEDLMDEKIKLTNENAEEFHIT